MNVELRMLHDRDRSEVAGAGHARTRRKIRLALYAAGALAVLTVGGTTFVPIGGAVMAPAQVVPESRIKRVAHPAGGVISEIFVRDGDEVEKGALLMRLDTSVSALDAELSERSLERLLAQRARLTAELENRGSIAFPVELKRDAAAAVAAEQRQFALNRAERASLTAQFGERVNQLRRQIDGYRAQVAALRQQRELIEPELEAVRKLKEKGYVTIRRVNEMERAAIELEGAMGALEASIAESNAAIAQAQEQNIQLGMTARVRAGSELAQVEAAINEQRVASISAGERYNRSEIRAPNAGTVDELSFNTVGEVVRPAETILLIVPHDDRLVFEGRIVPADIDQVRKGQAARVRLSAFNSGSTPEVTGKVTFVSPDLTSDPETGSRFYRVQVSLDAVSERTAASKLVSGMPAELFIQTGSRSMLSYILKPLTDQFARAFRD